MCCAGAALLGVEAQGRRGPGGSARQEVCGEFGGGDARKNGSDDKEGCKDEPIGGQGVRVPHADGLVDFLERVGQEEASQIQKDEPADAEEDDGVGVATFSPNVVVSVGAGSPEQVEEQEALEKLTLALEALRGRRGTAAAGDALDQLKALQECDSKGGIG
ncbi:unnamed protein product [Prorocentrum cordatum]|uniref:Uncharacterized protein n=1 Tax=Prorocentrum cordatum TaxID=2364126 RepID=A0ABN9W6P5_9DINO|nr:unnamed protein product [Polarella glacialis]